ncbi:DNA helicase [Tanacetum coccineum]
MQDAQQIDDYISAEIPDSVQDPKGYKLVTELMMHGPCGAASPSATCMQEGSCSKHFLKTYNDRTFFNSNGHTHYRRRDTGVHVMKGESKLDNCDVVPYNRALCLAFEAHINVEYCGWSMLIKYLFKYISKGPDRILAKISNSDESITATCNRPHIDEIQNYVDGRFICLYKACWRIFDFPIHSWDPAVQILNVHLENMQRVNFRESDRLDIIVNLPEKKKTTLTEWFVYNNENTDGRHLTYLDFPSEFVWYANSKRWQRRKVRTKKSIGRLTYVHPSLGDLFYLRMLLCHRKGCKSPIEVRTVNGQILPTYRAACEALGLLGDDKEWDISLEEPTVLATSKELRILFSQILIYCDVADPLKLWINIGKLWVMTSQRKSLRKQKSQTIMLIPKNYKATFCTRTPVLLRSRWYWENIPLENNNKFTSIPRENRGDFHQTLPVKKGASKEELIAASITESHLWPYFKVCTLKENMRLLRSGLTSEQQHRSEQFSKWLLDVVIADESGMTELIDFIYDDTTLKAPTAGSLQENAIVCPKNVTVDVVNAKILSNIEGQSKTYLSNDEAISLGTEIGETELLYPTEYLNTMTFPRLPPHELELKVGSPIMLLRNVNLSGGLCNGTRMIVRSLMSKLIEAQIITGTRIGEKVQFRIMSAATIASLRIGQEKCIMEAKVYRRWISKCIPKMKALAYCCILLHFDRQRDHHFELISYHQLSSRVPYRDENLKLSWMCPFGTPTISQKYLRKVDIEDLDGNIVEFTMWDELARQFDKREIKKLTPLIIIAVSSCRVTKYKDTQLSATPATHYYINPQTPEAQHVYTEFKEKYNFNPPLQIAKYRCQDPKEEKIRNRQTLHTLLEQNPTTFKGVHFTCEGMITSVQENIDWKYPSCSKCSKGSTQQNGTYICEDHGRQDPVAQKYKETGQQQFPTEIVNTIGKKHIFQIRYAPSTQQRAGAFIADDVLDIQLAVQTEDTGTAVATSSATPSKETVGKEKHIIGTHCHSPRNTTTE